MVKTAPQTHGRRPGRTRRIAVLIGLGLGLWAVLAYLALPALWSRLERQKALGGREMITRTAQGLPGDPINFGLIGEENEVLCAFRAAGWALADSISLRTSLRLAGSVAFRRADPQAPVSPLFYDGRVEDLALQLPDGHSAARRHHIRLWRIGAVFGPRPLWLASASYDRGVGLSHYTLQLTHRIGADLDAERGQVGADLAKVGAVEKFFQFAGVGPTLDAYNGGGDRYFTDGEVLVAALRPDCALRPGEAAAPPDNPVHVEIASALVHALATREDASSSPNAEMAPSPKAK